MEQQPLEGLARENPVDEPVVRGGQDGNRGGRFERRIRARHTDSMPEIAERGGQLGRPWPEGTDGDAVIAGAAADPGLAFGVRARSVPSASTGS